MHSLTLLVCSYIVCSTTLHFIYLRVNCVFNVMRLHFWVDNGRECVCNPWDKLLKQQQQQQKFQPALAALNFIRIVRIQCIVLNASTKKKRERTNTRHDQSDKIKYIKLKRGQTKQKWNEMKWRRKKRILDKLNHWLSKNVCINITTQAEQSVWTTTET